MEQAPPQSNPQPPPPPSLSTPPASTTDVSSAALPPPAPTSLPYPTQTPTPAPTHSPQVRPGVYNRPWPPQQQQQQQPQPPPPSSHYPHFSSPSAPNQRGGMAIGVPAAAHLSGAPNPTAAHIPPASFASHNPPFSGPTSSSPQVRPVMGPLGTSTAMRPPMAGPAHQLRPVQSSPRPQSGPNIQSPASQSFQGHAMLRVSATGSSGTPLPGSSQGLQPHNQPWLNANSQARPPLPSSHRPQINPQTLQQRSQAPPQHQNSVNATSLQQQVSQAQQAQQPSSSGPQEHHGPQFSQARVQQSLPNQPQASRSPSLGAQRAPQATIPSTAVQSSLPSRAVVAEPEEPCNRILRKRSIQELVTQVDPSEKLDPDVEDILVDIAEDFVESITSFGCSLAKHRKSSTLEAKDILLHLERNWNVTLPGFSGDEIKTYKKPLISDVHKERLAVVKKSILASETVNSKSSGGNPKGHVAKGPNSLVGSPPAKVREAA